MENNKKNKNNNNSSNSLVFGRWPQTKIASAAQLGAIRGTVWGNIKTFELPVLVEQFFFNAAQLKTSTVT